MLPREHKKQGDKRVNKKSKSIAEITADGMTFFLILPGAELAP
jgi:hypothetical protein